MPNHNAFISEPYYRSNTSIAEFIEVTLKASEDPADYTLPFHTQSGALYSGSNAPGEVSGLLLLSDPNNACLLYTSPSPRDRQKSRMPSSA